MSNTETLPVEHQGDMVFENGCLFLRDALQVLSRVFADAVKSGDLISVLKQWVFSYRGNGCTKYAHEMSGQKKYGMTVIQLTILPYTKDS